jgi:hypothetical protein
MNAGIAIPCAASLDAQIRQQVVDHSPKTVLFSGTCGDGCAFSVTVEDHGEPGTLDQFGITVSGAGVSEVRLQRVISRGNIQFHP